MRYALFSDIHSNRHAFEACLAHANLQGADRIVVLGDLVSYGAHPAEVVVRCQAIEHEGGIVLRGNHEELIQDRNLGKSPLQQTLGAQTAKWTHEQLSSEQRLWLDQLPRTAVEEDIFFVHASANAPEQWHYVENARSAGASLDAACAEAPVRYVFGGHVHQQTLYFRGTGRELMPFKPVAGIPVHTPRHRQWLATIGSVGQPRDGNVRAMYALFDSSAQQLTFHRVAYDYLAAARSVRAAGLPDFFADRLEKGR